MTGWRERMRRMGSHYANATGLNHTLPMIICWEALRLPGSLVCSKTDIHFSACVPPPPPPAPHSILTFHPKFYHFKLFPFVASDFIFEYECLLQEHKRVKPSSRATHTWPSSSISSPVFNLQSQYVSYSSVCCQGNSLFQYMMVFLLSWL